jgi:hypothetical protein
MGWRSSYLDIVINDYNIFSKEELENMDVYEFGVFTGDSMKEIASILSKHKIQVNSFYGFDVFTGMPKETAEKLPVEQTSWDPDIEPDAFNALKRLGLGTIDECVDKISQEVINIFSRNNNKSPVKIFPGLVQETIQSNHGNFKPAFYVDFDMDIYSPTKYAFDYLAKNNLIVKGTIIGYDDWGGTTGYKEMLDGESRSHREIVEEYGFEIRELFEIDCGPFNVQSIWIVESI